MHLVQENDIEIEILFVKIQHHIPHFFRINVLLQSR